MLCIALLAVALCIVPAGAQNLLRNGSFEGPTAENVPESWSFHDFTGDEMATGEVVGRARVGERCLKLKAPVFPADFTAYCRPIDVSDLQGRELIFSCFFRTVEHPQAQVTLVTYAESFTEREFVTQELLSESHPLGESRDWLHYATHLTVPPGARDLVVLLRALGGGEVFYDGAAVRVVGSELEVELEEAGTLLELPRERTVRCRLRNVTGREMPVRLEIDAREPEGDRRRESAEATLGPGEAQTLERRYAFDFRKPHHLQVMVLGDEPDEVHQAWEREVPGLVQARIVEPAFRSAVLSTVPSEQVVVEGRINAVEGIARRAELRARLMGTGEEARDPEFLSDEGIAGPWRLTLSTEGMLTENYLVNVTAVVGRDEHTLSLPLVREPFAEAEVAYDAEHRLWVNGQVQFPLGVYRVVDEDDLPGVAGAGFGFVITPSRSVSYRYFDSARDAGLHVAIWSPALDGLFWRNITDSYRGRQTLLGWCGIHLPDTQSVTTQTLAQSYVHSTSGPYPAIAQMDAHHPVMLALRPNATMEEFAQVADIVLAWSEPVPRWPLISVAESVQMARDAVDDRKPVWAVIQTAGYGWSDDLRLAKPEDSRPPTPAEFRAMVYLALSAGADGLVYHSWSLPARGDWPSWRLQRDAPELWEAVQETNRELTWLAPILLEADPEPVTLEYECPVRMAAWEHDGARYVIAVNAEDTTAAMVFDIGATPESDVEVLFERRRVEATAAGEVGDVFEPYAVHIYRVGGE